MVHAGFLHIIVITVFVTTFPPMKTGERQIVGVPWYVPTLAV